jgi:hypothetical protein
MIALCAAYQRKRLPMKADELGHKLENCDVVLIGDGAVSREAFE